ESTASPGDGIRDHRLAREEPGARASVRAATRKDGERVGLATAARRDVGVDDRSVVADGPVHGHGRRGGPTVRGAVVVIEHARDVVAGLWGWRGAPLREPPA